MPAPESHVTWTPEEVEELRRRLAQMRHNVNNLLALVVAGTELIRRKPESASRLVENISDQPQRVVDEIQRFSEELERLLSKRPDGV
jgi:predicted  nucleic acid-binding Zn-ribbon protein